MVENISKIRQLFAESKFVEVQKEAELVIYQSKSSTSKELLEIYLNSLKAQSRPLPAEQVFLLIDKLLPSSPDEAQEWLLPISKERVKDTQRVLLIEIQIAELKGKTEDLYNLISRYQIEKFEACNPSIPIIVQTLTKKYFPNDFHIQLQRLAIELMRKELAACEQLIKELILSCFERSSPKGTKEKLNSLYEVLRTSDGLQHLELYKNFCNLMYYGFLEKKDYKKVIEFVIFFEDFKFQALILNLMVKEKLDDIAAEYAHELRQNKEYNYVYLDKFFPHLKKFFYQRPQNKTKPSSVTEKIDLTVEKSPSYQFYDEILFDVTDEEILLSQLLKHQNFTTSELLDVAVSFFQSELYIAALKASELAYASSVDSNLKLRSSYLRVTCLLKTGDFRAALDISLNALNISETQNDILSFLYSRAEAHLRLKEYKSAKSVLKKILSIDSSYRMARERLDRLNAI